METRALRSNLVVGAVGIWMLNALNFRPEGGKFDQVADACCQHILDPGSDSEYEELDDDDEEKTIPIGYDRGIYFLGDLMEDNDTFRVPMAIFTRLEEVVLSWVYGRASMAILEHDVGIHRVLAPKGTLTHKSRIPNKRQKTTAVQYVRDPDVGGDVVEWQLADRGIAVRPVARDRGRDVDEHTIAAPEENEGGIGQADEAVSRIWGQAPFDIFAVGPNSSRSKDPSHVLLSNVARRNVTWAAFHTTDFTGVFEKVQIRLVSEEFWTTTLFDRYFPPKGTQPKERGKLQNFPYTTYYNQWFKLMSQLSSGQAKLVRARVLIEFKKLKWLPHGGSDRMWATCKMSGNNWTRYPAGSKAGPCPQIAVNLSTWNREAIIVGVRAAAEEEEEEEEAEEEAEGEQGD